jgi:PIN domain nuclease of toxin-antitoxin system
VSRFLLDSNIVIAIAEERFEGIAAPVLQDDTAEKFVSVASLWEIAIKCRLGKLELAVGPEELGVLLRALDLEVLEIEESHVFADIGQELVTRDPFDRLLLGVCAAENLRLVTRDRELAQHPLAWRGVPSVKK